jgi:peptidyl-prolyl cis-trans isomerase D
VDAITRKPGKTLDQARAEIVAAMTLEKRRAALTDMSAKIEQQFENGTSLADVAKSMGLTVQTTAPLLATGQVFGKPAEKAPADVAPLLAAVFSMEREGEPQISEVPGSTKFALFDVGEITEAAPRRWRRSRTWSRDYAADQGSAQAKIASDKIMAALAKGTSLADALKTLGVALPARRP